MSFDGVIILDVEWVSGKGQDHRYRSSARAIGTDAGDAAVVFTACPAAL
jgi:hypothetical protein